MRTVIQRVTNSKVEVNNSIVGEIGKGFLILVGFENADDQEDLEWVASKITKLRVFDDENGVMNLSITDIGGEALIISQFTLHAKTKKGNRPSYIQAAPPEVAIPLYEKFIQLIKNELKSKVQTGIFGAKMDVSLTNDGPVTIIIDSKNRE